MISERVREGMAGRTRVGKQGGHPPGPVGGDIISSISSTFDTSNGALQQYKADHLPWALTNAQGANVARGYEECHFCAH